MKRIGISVLSLALAGSLAIAPQAVAQSSITSPETTTAAASGLTEAERTKLETALRNMETENGEPSFTIELDGVTWSLENDTYTAGAETRTFEEMTAAIKAVLEADAAGEESTASSSALGSSEVPFDVAAAKALVERLKSSNPPYTVEWGGQTWYLAQDETFYVLNQADAGKQLAEIADGEAISVEAFAARIQGQIYEFETTGINPLAIAAGLGVAAAISSSGAGGGSSASASGSGSSAQGEANGAVRGVAAQTGVNPVASVLLSLTVLSVIGAAAFAARRFTA